MILVQARNPQQCIRLPSLPMSQVEPPHHLGSCQLVQLHSRPMFFLGQAAAMDWLHLQATMPLLRESASWVLPLMLKVRMTATGVSLPRITSGRTIVSLTSAEGQRYVHSFCGSIVCNVIVSTRLLKTIRSS